MRIALFTDTYLPDVNGVVTSVDLLRRKLEDHGHEVYVVCNHPGLLSVKREGNIIRLPGLELRHLYGYKMSQPIHLLLAEEIRKYHFDIIHIQQEFGVSLFGGMCARMFHIPLVRTYHTAYEDYTEYFLPLKNQMVENTAKLAVRRLSYHFGNSCMCMVAPSQKTKDMLIGYGIKTPIRVIPTGLEIQRFYPENQDAEKVRELRMRFLRDENTTLFVYVGRVALEKGILGILRTFKEVKHNHLNCRLIIVGDGPAYGQVEKLVKDFELEDYVVLEGRRPNTEVPLYYNMADCFVTGSTTETQGMTYIEAMSSSLPQIVKNDAVIDGIIVEGKNGYLFEDDEELYQKIVQFMNLDQEDLLKMKEEALKTAKGYDADLFAEKMIQMYEDVINEFKYNEIFRDEL